MLLQREQESARRNTDVNSKVCRMIHSDTTMIDRSRAQNPIVNLLQSQVSLCGIHYLKTTSYVFIRFEKIF